jgi:hypothetical protein
MLEPLTEPVYVIAVEPTVPKLILSPETEPLIGTVPAVLKSIVPDKVEPDCVHVRVKVPVNAPEYWPCQVPPSAPVDADELVSAALLDVAADVDVTAEVDVGGVDVEEEFLLDEQDVMISATAATPPANAVSLDICGPSDSDAIPCAG